MSRNQFAVNYAFFGVKFSVQNFVCVKKMTNIRYVYEMIINSIKINHVNALQDNNDIGHGDHDGYNGYGDDVDDQNADF